MSKISHFSRGWGRQAIFPNFEDIVALLRKYFKDKENERGGCERAIVEQGMRVEKNEKKIRGDGTVCGLKERRGLIFLLSLQMSL